MFTRVQFGVVALVLVLGGLALGEVVIRVQVFEEAGQMPATQPAGGQKEAVLTVETLANGGGAFMAKTSLGKETIQVKGTINAMENGRHRVKVSFSDQVGRSPGMVNTQEVSSSIEVSLDKPQVIGGLRGPHAGVRTVVLTVADQNSLEGGAR